MALTMTKVLYELSQMLTQQEFEKIRKEVWRSTELLMWGPERLKLTASTSSSCPDECSSTQPDSHEELAPIKQHLQLRLLQTVQLLVGTDRWRRAVAAVRWRNKASKQDTKGKEKKDPSSRGLKPACVLLHPPYGQQTSGYPSSRIPPMYAMQKRSRRASLEHASHCEKRWCPHGCKSACTSITRVTGIKCGGSMQLVLEPAESNIENEPCTNDFQHRTTILELAKSEARERHS